MHHEADYLSAVRDHSLGWSSDGPVPQGRDPASLLPAKTLAYLEVRHPEELCLELARLIKGSALENMPATFARFRSQHPTNQFWFMQEVAMFSLLLSPETLAEAGRLESAALAVTGFTKDNEPEIVGFVLAGRSNAPTFFLRAYLSMDDVHIVDEVEKVPLYRGRNETSRRSAAAALRPPIRRKAGRRSPCCPTRS